MTALNILSYILIAAIALPFLFLGALFIATYFDLGIADPLLDAVVFSLKTTWIIGSIVNIIGGLALIALSVWLPFHEPTLTHWGVAMAVLALGLWRIWRGFTAFPRAE